MTPLHTGHRWLTVCLGIVLGVFSLTAAAIDPGTIKGKFTHKGKDSPLTHVYAWQPYAQAKELWVYVTDTEVPAAAAKDFIKPAELAKENRFRGVKLVIHPTNPDLNSLEAVPYAPGERGMLTASGTSPKWQHLRVGDKRVAGKLKYEGGDWSLDAEFSAPVFGSSGKMQTLIGAQAQKSPQAEVFLACEKALLWEGINAAGAHMTPERLAGMQGMLKQFGGDGFKQMQTERRKSTPQGEARRKQIEKVVVDGDNAVLEARPHGEKYTEVMRLAKTKDGWKIAE